MKEKSGFLNLAMKNQWNLGSCWEAKRLFYFVVVGAKGVEASIKTEQRRRDGFPASLRQKKHPFVRSRH